MFKVKYASEPKVISYGIEKKDNRYYQEFVSVIASVKSKEEWMKLRPDTHIISFVSLSEKEIADYKQKQQDDYVTQVYKNDHISNRLFS